MRALRLVGFGKVAESRDARGARRRLAPGRLLLAGGGVGRQYLDAMRAGALQGRAVVVP